MTTANNIQMATYQATPTKKNNEIKEAGKMTHDNNIHGHKSLVSNFIRTNRAILAGLLIGGAIAAASMLPGNASADNPARPVGDPESAATIGAGNTANVMDMDLLDPGFYDAKLIPSSNTGSAFDLDLLDPGIYDAKLIPSSSTGSAFDIDLLDPGFYDAKLVSVSSVWESPGFDPYEDMPSKVIRSSNTGSAFDMDLLDPGIYDAKLVSTSPSLEGLESDNII